MGTVDGCTNVSGAAEGTATFTPSVNGELVFISVYSSGGQPTVLSGFTKLDDNNDGQWGSFQYKIQTTATPVSASVSSFGGVGAFQICGWKPALAASGGQGGFNPTP